MSALRNAHLPPDRMFTFLGPASPAPLRGFSHHGASVTGGSFLRPLPSPSPARDAVCGMCGEPLPPRRSTRGAVQQWCSEPCRHKASRARKADAE